MPKVKYSHKTKADAERDYVTGKLTLSEVSDKYKIRYTTLKQLAWENDWVSKRREWLANHVKAPEPGHLPVMEIRGDKLEVPLTANGTQEGQVQVQITPEFFSQAAVKYHLELEHIGRLMEDARDSSLECPPGKEKAAMIQSYNALLDRYRIMLNIPAPGPRKPVEKRVKATAEVMAPIEG